MKEWERSAPARTEASLSKSWLSPWVSLRTSVLAEEGAGLEPTAAQPRGLCDTCVIPRVLGPTPSTRENNRPVTGVMSQDPLQAGVHCTHINKTPTHTQQNSGCGHFLPFPPIL